MTLDLNDLLADWNCPAGEICARVVVGRDGAELLQLRVDLGVMQMFPDGPPDGRRFRGLPSVLEYCQHELRLAGSQLTPADWRELEREVHQLNYRRLALTSLAEAALGRGDEQAARLHLCRALRDTQTCLTSLRLAAARGGAGFSPTAMALRTTLVFHLGRLSVQLRIVEKAYEEAVEEAVRGVRRLDALLAELGLDGEQRAQDPGITFLRRLEQRLRREYEIPATRRERLEQAIAQEDFETAARLRDELRRRARKRSRGPRSSQGASAAGGAAAATAIPNGRRQPRSGSV